MRFGIFFELSVRPPSTGALERQVYANAIEQAMVAEERRRMITGPAAHPGVVGSASPRGG